MNDPMSEYRDLCRDVCARLGVEANSVYRIDMRPDRAIVEMFWRDAGGRYVLNADRSSVRRVIAVRPKRFQASDPNPMPHVRLIGPWKRRTGVPSRWLGRWGRDGTQSEWEDA